MLSASLNKTFPFLDKHFISFCVYLVLKKIFFSSIHLSVRRSFQVIRLPSVCLSVHPSSNHLYIKLTIHSCGCLSSHLSQHTNHSFIHPSTHCPSNQPYIHTNIHTCISSSLPPSHPSYVSAFFHPSINTNTHPSQQCRMDSLVKIIAIIPKTFNFQFVHRKHSLVKACWTPAKKIRNCLQVPIRIGKSPVRRLDSLHTARLSTLTLSSRCRLDNQTSPSRPWDRRTVSTMSVSFG